MASDYKNVAEVIAQAMTGDTTHSYVTAAPVSLRVEARSSALRGYQTILTPRYEPATRALRGPNDSEPVRAHTDRNSEFFCPEFVTLMARGFGASLYGRLFSATDLMLKATRLYIYPHVVCLS